MLAAVKTNYEGNCQDSRHEAHGGKYLLTGRFEFFLNSFSTVSETDKHFIRKHDKSIAALTSLI